MNEYFGFYRGIVLNNDDSRTKTPYRARIQVYVPQVYGQKLVLPDELPWAEPCLPLLGGGRSEDVSHGIVALPPIDSTVWVGFEHGDPQTPIWFGTWYGGRDVSENGYEMPQQAVADNALQARYPNILLIKAPWSPAKIDEENTAVQDGLYIRFSEGKKIEIVFHQGSNYIELNGVAKKILLNALGWDVHLKAQRDQDSGGNVTIQAVPDGDENGGIVTIQGREVRVQATENISVVAAEDCEIRGDHTNKFSSRRVIYGNAPSASGFEDH